MVYFCNLLIFSMFRSLLILFCVDSVHVTFQSSGEGTATEMVQCSQFEGEEENHERAHSYHPCKKVEDVQHIRIQGHEGGLQKVR